MTRFFSPTSPSRAALRGTLLALTLVLAVPLGTSSVDARAGGGFSFGSRGSRTFSMPPSTNTAPRWSQPMQRSETPSSGFGSSGLGSAAQPRRFGFGSGLAAGLLGAGVLGMLTGNGFFGGLGGVMSLFGFLLQLALIGWLISLALRFFRGRSSPVLAGAGAGFARTPYAGPPGSSYPGAAAQTRGGQPITIGPQDYAAFERALTEIQNAYGREDINALSRLTTGEMLRNFGGELEENRRRGVRNALSEVKLLQGDLAEAWREGGTDYATVAMRFAVLDAMVDRATGRVVSGDPTRPTEATELWTFRREGGSPWLLSAIQQAG